MRKKWRYELLLICSKKLDQGRLLCGQLLCLEMLCFEPLHFEPVRYLLAYWLITVACQWLSTGHIQASSNPSCKSPRQDLCLYYLLPSEYPGLRNFVFCTFCFLGDGPRWKMRTLILFFLNEIELSYFKSVFYHNPAKHSCTNKRWKKPQTTGIILFEQIPNSLAVAA